MSIPFVVTQSISDAFFYGLSCGLLISIVAFSAYCLGVAVKRGDKP